MLLASAIVITACQTTGSGTSNVTCSTMRFVYLSKKDTPVTITQVAENNAAWISLCGNPPPVKKGK